MKDAVREDYSRNQAAVERVVASLHDDGSRFGGWVIEGWTDVRSQFRGDSPLATWTDGSRLRLRRAFRVRKTRHAMHQQLVEDRGEVIVGNNTYVHEFSESYSGDIGGKHDSRVDTYSSIFEVAIGLAALVTAAGRRPTDRVSDDT